MSRDDIIASSEAEINAFMTQLEADDLRRQDELVAARRAKIIQQEACNRYAAKQKATADALAATRQAAAKVQQERDIEAGRAKLALERAEEARRTAEMHRLYLAAEGAKRAASFPVWVRNGYGFALDGRFFKPIMPEGWTMESLENAFWNHIEVIGGFKTCPKCGAKPKVNKRGTYAAPAECGNGMNTTYLEGLFSLTNLTTGAVCYFLESISCCDHLFDLKTNQHFIKTESMKDAGAEADHKKFVIQNKGGYLSFYPNHYPQTTYAPYDPTDADGSSKAVSQAELARLAEITQLEERLALLRSSSQSASALAAIRTMSSATASTTIGAPVPVPDMDFNWRTGQ